MKGKGEGENDGKAGEGHDHGHADLRQGPDAQRSKEFGPGFIADREYEQAEEDRFEQWRDHEVSELTEHHGTISVQAVAPIENPAIRSRPRNVPKAIASSRKIS